MAPRLGDDFEDELLYLEYMERHGNECEGIIVERGDPFEELRDRKFVERFHLSKQTVSFLLETMQRNLQFPTQRNNPVPAINRLLTALRFKTHRAGRAGRATERQLEEMLSYMEQHPQFACARFVGKEGREAVSRQWQRLTNMLNSVPRGAYKDSKQWQTVWRDIKFNVSKKAGGFKHQNSEGVGKVSSLTAIEMRTLDVMRMHGVEGGGGEAKKKEETSYVQDLIHQSGDSPFEVVYVGSEKEAFMEDATTPSDDSESSRFPQVEKETEEIVVMDGMSTNVHETHTTTLQRSHEQCPGTCKSLLNLQEGFLKTQQMLAEASTHQAEAAALQAKTAMLHAENACKQTEMIDRISKLLEKQTANEERQMTILENLMGIVDRVKNSEIKCE